MQGPTFDHLKHLFKILIQLNSFRNDFPLALATAGSECQQEG